MEVLYSFLVVDIFVSDSSNAVTTISSSTAIIIIFICYNINYTHLTNKIIITSIILKLNNLSCQAPASANRTFFSTTHILYYTIPAKYMSTRSATLISNLIIAYPAQLLLVVRLWFLYFFCYLFFFLCEKCVQIQNSSEALHQKNSKKKPPLYLIIRILLILVFESVDVPCAQNTINKIIRLVPAKHENHKHKPSSIGDKSFSISNNNFLDLF